MQETITQYKTAQEVYKDCRVDGNLIYLPATQLDRNLYLEVANGLQLIGGKWKRKYSAFEFQQDPTELLLSLASGEKRNLKKEFQFFATPKSLAAEMVRLAMPENNTKILEPSAGQGAIIDEILSYCRLKDITAPEVWYCELMDLNRSILERKYKEITDIKVSEFKVKDNDFLQADNNTFFDIIIANPPFSKNQDIDHIRKMYSLLKPGGLMVAIASKHWIYSQNKKENDFRTWLYDTVDASVNPIDAGAFNESGTSIATVMIIVYKPR